jgi:hypothetical protein
MFKLTSSEKFFAFLEKWENMKVKINASIEADFFCLACLLQNILT